MRKLFLLIIVLLGVSAVVAAAVGALHVRSDEEKINVIIDKKKLQEKAEGALEKTKEAGSALLEKAGEALHKTGPGASPESKGEQAPETPKPRGSQTERQAESTGATLDETSLERIPPGSG